MITFRAASYGPRYGDPIATAVAVELGEGILIGGKAWKAACKAAAFEEQEIRSFCDNDDQNCECSLCKPDLVCWGEHTHSAQELFTAAELKEHRRALMNGEVVFLYP